MCQDLEMTNKHLKLELSRAAALTSSMAEPPDRRGLDFAFGFAVSWALAAPSLAAGLTLGLRARAAAGFALNFALTASPAEMPESRRRTIVNYETVREQGFAP